MGKFKALAGDFLETCMLCRLSNVLDADRRICFREVPSYKHI